MNKLKTFLLTHAEATSNVIKFIVAIIILALSVSVYILNVKYEERLTPDSRCYITQVTSDIVKVSSIYSLSSVALDRTTDIIVRDGNINPTTARKYANWIHAAGLKYKINPVLILSVMAVESRFDAKAKSPLGPIGLLQITYSFHKEKTTKLGLYDPKNNIFVGTQILKEYSDISKSESETLLRYNGSLGFNRGYARKVLLNKHKYEKEIRSNPVLKTT